VQTLDPRQPLVFDTVELGRRAGAMATVTRNAPAPAGLGTEVIGVPEGTPLDVQGRLESVVEGVLATVVVTTRAIGECSRCLDPVELPVSVELQELYEYDDPEMRPSNDEESDLFRLEGDLLDLEPALRDAVVLALPRVPLCDEDCLGLCPQCGVRMDAEPDHEHELLDSRWSALEGLLTEPKEG
jgi:uncharacterized protein